MSYSIIWDKKAKKFLKKLEPKESKRIIKKVNEITDNPKRHLNTLVKINLYKLRIGDYRALIDLNENKKLIEVVLVKHRKNIYKN